MANLDLRLWFKENVKEYKEYRNGEVLITRCPQCKAHLAVHEGLFACYGYAGCKECNWSCRSTCRANGTTIAELKRLYGK